MGNVNLPRRTRSDLVAAARAGVRPEDLAEHEAKNREVKPPRMLTAPIRKTGDAHRVEIDAAHYNVMEKLSKLAVLWAERLEQSGLPATHPNEWRSFAEAVSQFRYIDAAVGMWSPGEVTTMLELIEMRSDLADGG
jgi:hypothetical protein